jgi:acetylornithine/succinyldiaminopimelate/putrescine aminotransferase
MCVHSSNLHRHPYQEALAARLAAWSGLDLVFLSNSGTEAMEAALKAARARANALGRRRQRIVALEGSFHGRSAGALAVTGQGKYRDPFGPLTPDVVFVGANDMAALRAAVNEETIAIVAETILGEGGVVPLTAEFLEGIRGLATRREALWIADETQCGLGRTGERFAYQRFGLLPDVVVTAKPLGGGLPLGATMFSAEAGAALGQGMHGTTFGGGPLACRVAGKGPDGGFGTGRAGGAGGGTGARGGVDHQLHAGECAAISAAVCGGAGGDRFCLRGGAG